MVDASIPLQARTFDMSRILGAAEQVKSQRAQRGMADEKMNMAREEMDWAREDREQEDRATKVKTLSNLMATVQNAPPERREDAYQQARQTAGRLGVPAESMPERYDPQWMETQINRARDIEDVLDDRRSGQGLSADQGRLMETIGRSARGLKNFPVERRGEVYRQTIAPMLGDMGVNTDNLNIDPDNLSDEVLDQYISQTDEGLDADRATPRTDLAKIESDRRAGLINDEQATRLSTQAMVDMTDPPDYLDETGNVKVTASNSMSRQVGTLLGGSYSVEEGVFQGLSRDHAIAGQELIAQAESILQEGQVAGVGQAVAEAMGRVELPEDVNLSDIVTDLEKTVEGEATPSVDDLSAGEIQRRREAAHEAAEVVDVQLGTGLGSSIVSAWNNTIGQLDPSLVDQDVSRARQRLAMLETEFINAFSRNPRQPVWEQMRLQRIFTAPHMFRSPEEVREQLREMGQLLDREIEWAKRELDMPGLPADRRSEILSSTPGMIRFRRQLKDFSLNPAGDAQETELPPAPEGVEPEEWRFMTPEERALWE